MVDGSLRLAFVGDVCLNAVDEARGRSTAFPGWPAIRDEIGKYDLLVGNLECCLVDDRCSEAARRQPMAVPVKASAFLRATGFTDMCLANNHILDCGPAAITATRECLASQRIRAFGAGADRHEAEQAVIAHQAGRKIAFLGACDSSEYFAGANGRAGCAPLKRLRLGRRVRAAAAQADLVVVTLHADLEFSIVPAPWRQRLARWLIDQGAHLIIQHHPHVLQGVESYHGGLIAYSLGNFVFGIRGNRYQEREAGVSDSAVLTVDAQLDGPAPRFTWDIIPVCIGDDHLPRLLDDAAQQEAVRRFQALSAAIADHPTRRRVWRRRCRREATRHIFAIYYAIMRGHVGRASGYLWRLFTSPEERRWILGLLSRGYL